MMVVIAGTELCGKLRGKKKLAQSTFLPAHQGTRKTKLFKNKRKNRRLIAICNGRRDGRDEMGVDVHEGSARRHRSRAGQIAQHDNPVLRPSPCEEAREILLRQDERSLAPVRRCIEPIAPDARFGRRTIHSRGHEGTIPVRDVLHPGR